MKNLINTIANAVFTGKTKTEKVIKPKRKSPVKRGKLTATQKAEIIEEYAKKSITQSKLVLDAKVSGIEASQFADLVKDAQMNCPVSKLLNTSIVVEYTLN